MIFRSKLVELQLPANIADGDQYNFANDADLQNAYIVGLTAYSQNEFILAPSGASVLNSLVGVGITITELSQKERIRTMPLTDFNTQVQGGFIRYFYPFQLNWQDSYVTLFDSTTINPNEAVLVNVFYIPTSEIKNYEELYAFYGQ
jgi:hypothetical protein